MGMSEMVIKPKVFHAILDDMCPFCKKRAMHILADNAAIPAPDKQPLRSPRESLVELLTRICVNNHMDTRS